MPKKTDVYIDDPDDCRPRYSRRQRRLRLAGVILLLFLSLLVYLFLPPWLYPVLLVAFMYFVYNTERSPRTERQRLDAYLERIPASGGLTRSKFISLSKISEAEIDEILRSFDSLPAREQNFFSETQMRQIIKCWYYTKIKQCTAESVQDAVFTSHKATKRL